MNKMTTNGDIRLQSIFEPFKQLVDDPSFYTNTNVMNVILGHMGQGKTYQLQNHLIPYVIQEKRVKLVITTVPNNEIADKKSWNKCGLDSGAYVLNCIHDNVTLEDLENHLEDGDPVIIVMTTAKLINSFGEGVIAICREKGVHSAIFCDECHTQFTSAAENSKDNIGWKYSDDPIEGYKAVVYNAVASISRYTPYVFGLTATTNAEQRGELPVLGDMIFREINELPKKNYLIDTQCWLKDYYCYNIYDSEGKTNKILYQENALSRFESDIHSMMKENSRLNKKQVMMIAVPNDNSVIGVTIDQIVNHLYDLNEKYNYWKEEDFIFATMFSSKSYANYSGKRFYSFDGSRIKSDDQAILAKLRDPNDKLCMLFVKQKGNMGISVSNLNYFFSFKTQDKSDSLGESIIEFAVQQIGRLVRPFYPISNKELYEKYNGDMKEYISTLDDKEIQELLSLNSFQYSVPNTDMWKNAVYEFNRNRCSTVSQAETWITNNIK